MKIKYLLSAFILTLCLALSGCAGSGLGNVLNAATDTAVNDDVVTQAESATVTMRDIEQFLKDKREHYPLSDEFIEKYQQTSGGYIDLAKKTAGMVVDKEKHEPNQKWHFFESWLYPSIEDETLTWEDSAQNRVYSKLLCPELLLWIYEACGVDPAKVKAANDVAEQGKVAKTPVASIAKNMRACVPWEDLANAITNYTPSESITLNPKKLTLTVGGDDATITATVVANDASGVTQWRITEGTDLISIDGSGNTVTVHAIAKGTAKLTATYGDNLTAECVVTVKEPLDPSTQTPVKYNLQGTSTSQFKTTQDALAAFKLVGDGQSIIVSVDKINYIAGGGSGGSNDNRWSSTEMLKIGSTSQNGSITLTLNVAVSSVIITGYVHNAKCEIRVGDGNSTDWTDDADDGKTTTVVCSEMTVVSKDSIENGQTETIVVDFESATTITIATINTTSAKYPLYITSIEFVIANEAAQ